MRHNLHKNLLVYFGASCLLLGMEPALRCGMYAHKETSLENFLLQIVVIWKFLGWTITATLPFNTGTLSYLACTGPVEAARVWAYLLSRRHCSPGVIHPTWISPFRIFFRTIAETRDEFDLGWSVSRFLMMDLFLGLSKCFSSRK